MKVVVTGAAGFIGSHLAERLAQEGHEVYGLDNLCAYYSVGLKKRNVAAIVNRGVTFIEADLTENLQKRLPEKVDYVFHLAAQPGISAATSLREYVQNNIFATQNLVEWVLRYSPGLNCLVNIATSSIYGKIADVSEEAPPKPISFYGATKLAAEQLVLGEQRLGKLRACSLRLYSVYGPRERPEKLYTRLMECIYTGTPFPLYKGSESHSRSFTYVGDIVKGIMETMGKERRIDGEIINIGSDEEHTTGEGIALVEKITGKRVLLQPMPPRAGDQLKTTAVIDKARTLLGYEPTTSLEEGLRAQVRWYQEQFL